VARRPLSSALLLLVLAGCATLIAPPRQSVAPDAQRALKLLSDRWNQFADLRTLADLELTRDGSKDRLQGVLLVKSPASVRFEALSPFGQPFLFLVIHDGDLVMYNAAANEALLAPATADSMARLLSLPFEPADAVSILVGRPAPPRDLRRAAIEQPDASGSHEGRTVEHPEGRPLVMVGPFNEQRVWMDFETGLVRQVEITGGRYGILVRYERDEQGELTGLSVSAPRAKLASTIAYRRPEFGVGLEEDRFDIAVPRSATIERLR
jgi:outer membrane lipoprotein-sorting protein